jgi:hypothetical protein
MVERLRAAAGDGDSTSHEDRLDYVQHCFPDAIHSAYHILQNVSMLARYQSIADFYAQFQAEDVEKKIVNHRLAKVTDYVASEIATRKTGPAR